MSSLWVFNVELETATNCASNCADYCGGDVRYLNTLRSGLFGSVAAANAAY
jgi:hypothetical protein